MGTTSVSLLPRKLYEVNINWLQLDGIFHHHHHLREFHPNRMVKNWIQIYAAQVIISKKEDLLIFFLKF